MAVTRSATSSIRVEEGEQRVTITLDRPERRNALDVATLNELIDVLRAATASGPCRVVLLRGAGTIFCAGADLSPVRHIVDPLERKRVFAPHAARIAELIGVLVGLLQDPSIIAVAEVNGHAIGGGWILAMGCDFRVAAAEAEFWFPEIDLGRIAGSAAIAMMTELAGPTAAREMFMLARRYRALDLLSRGLVTQVVPRDALDDAAGLLCDRLSALGGQLLSGVKARVIDSVPGRSRRASWRE